VTSAPELPADVAAERIVLGALMSGASLAETGLTSSDFSRPAHQLIFEAVAGLCAKRAPADPVAVADELRRLERLLKMGGAPYLHTCLAAVPAVAQAGYYAGIVRELSCRRRLMVFGSRVAQAAASPGENLADISALISEGADILSGNPGGSGRRLVLTPASEIEPEPVVWAWEDDDHGRIPAGSFGLFAGREGTGKSSFLIWLAAKITRGELPGSLAGPRGVIYVAVEDSWKYTIAPRLIAAGANLDLVYRAEVEEVGDAAASLSLPSDNELLEQAIRSHRVAMVALDPLMSAISDRLDTHVNRQVRQALDPLARIADRTGAVFAGIAHFNKSAGTDASSLITASGAFKDVARFIFAFAADTEDGTKVITQTKNSLGHGGLPSLAYRIIEATVPTAKGDARVGRLVVDGTTDRTVQDILSVQSGPPERDEKSRAEEYLREALAAGPRQTKDIEEEAREKHRITKRTLDRARASLRIPTAKRGTSWWISLPEHEGDLADITPPKPAKDANPANATSPRTVGMVGTVDGNSANRASNGRVGILGDWPEGSYGEAAGQ
jgi:hypothetical protein